MYRNFVKPFLDLCSALIALLIFLPIIAIVALIIKLEDGGPILFTHKRFGKDKKPFSIYKFRSMKTSAPRDMPTSMLLNPEEHIMRSGRIMRKLSLDEIPQLFNVIRGDMSIVGPRPVVLNETDLIAQRQKYKANSCKPGITGWAQVNGRDEIGIAEKAKLDGEYVRRMGLFMDIKCILLTIYAVVLIKGHKEGASEDSRKHAYVTESENS